MACGGRAFFVDQQCGLAHPLLKSMPSLWGAVFADAGDAAANPSDLHVKLGYGAGPLAPCRAL